MCADDGTYIGNNDVLEAKLALYLIGDRLCSFIAVRMADIQSLALRVYHVARHFLANICKRVLLAAHLVAHNKLTVLIVHMAVGFHLIAGVGGGLYLLRAAGDGGIPVNIRDFGFMIPLSREAPRSPGWKKT